ncbi:hypothetical protein FRC10_003723 [Ceratobasidium sp. 414]|nr:hypothetical protein FRC10_003723 [Ceratobasidium sp. 414]
MDELKRSWREQVERKLLKLGCTQKEEDLPYEKRARWKSFFNHAEVLTDNRWTSLKRQILSFVETEAQDRPERERKQRYASRASALRVLFNSVRYVADTLPEDLSGVTAAETVPMLAKWLPPPEYDAIRESPIIQDLLDTDVSVEDMTIQFEERRGEITQLVIDWGTRIKQGWANILREGRKNDGLIPDPPRPHLPTSRASTDPFNDVDPDTSLLLRADNLFNFAGGSYSGVRSYDTLVMALRQGGSRYEAIGYGKFDLTKYTWDSEASAIARKLLPVVGHQDASTVEFNADPAQPFACGRCNVSGRSWIALVVHYVEEARKWNTVQARLPDLAKLGIIYNYIHDLEPNNPRPPIKRVSEKEEEVVAAKSPQATQTSDANNVDDSEKPPVPNLEGGADLAASAGSGSNPDSENNGQGGHNEQAKQEGDAEMAEDGNDAEAEEDDDEMEEDEPFPDCFVCKICERARIKSPFFSELSDIFPHLVDVHEISDPQAGINGEGPQSIKDSPHIRLIPSYQAFGGWGISFLSGPVAGSGH